MSRAALTVYDTLRKEESQKNVVSLMQTHAERYDYLDYHAFEQKLDAALSKAEQPCAQRQGIDALRNGCREPFVEKPAAGIR